MEQVKHLSAQIKDSIIIITRQLHHAVSNLYFT